MIRSTTLLDNRDIIELVKTFYPQTPYSKWADFDEDTVIELVTKLRKSGILFVAQEEGKLVGIIGAVGLPFIFNANITSCHEVVWYVLPEYRKTTIGLQLLRKADQVRKLRGWKSFQMVRLEESSPTLDQVFVTEGFLPTEHCFTKVD